MGLPMKAEFPAGASANRAAIPAPNPSALPKIMVQSEGGQEAMGLGGGMGPAGGASSSDPIPSGGSV